jgi:hypothetical protein
MTMPMSHLRLAMRTSVLEEFGKMATSFIFLEHHRIKGNRGSRRMDMHWTKRYLTKENYRKSRILVYTPRQLTRKRRLDELKRI